MKLTDFTTLLADMEKKHGKLGHPRLILTERDFDRLRSHTEDGSLTAKLLTTLCNEAEALMDAPISEYQILDGIRLLPVSRQVLERVRILALAYNIFREVRFAERCYAELASAAKFKDWNPSHFLDVAEMSTAFAIGYDWLYHWMDNVQRQVIREAILEKGLMQGLEDYTDASRIRTYRWYQDSPGDNWKVVCNGSMTIAALAIGDEIDCKLVSDVFRYAYHDSYQFIRYAYNAKDGSYGEGMGYWAYATMYLGYYVSALTSAVGTDYGLAESKALEKSADFVRYMSSNSCKSFAFGDVSIDGEALYHPVLLWMGTYFGRSDIAAMRVKRIREGDYDPMDLLWFHEEAVEDSFASAPLDWGAVGAHNASLRNSWDASGIVAALHVGTNDYKYHGHYDLGSFYIESENVRFFTDLGADWYELPDREGAYRIRAEGHNTLVINPSEERDQKPGAVAEIDRFESGDEACVISDLTDAYTDSGAEKIVRTMKMNKDTGRVLIQDEIRLKTPGEVYWFAHTTAKITPAEDNRSVILSEGDKCLWVGIIGGEGNFIIMNAEPLSTSPKVPGQADNAKYKKLAIHMTDITEASLCVAFVPLRKGDTLAGKECHNGGDKQMNISRFSEPYTISNEKLDQAIHKALDKLRKRINEGIATFSDPETQNGKYTLRENDNWCCGMNTGLYWLAYELSGEEGFRKNAEEQLLTYKDRFKNKVNLNDHDVGFVFSPSCVAAYKLTGDEEIKKLALDAAEYYYNNSYSQKGRFIIRSNYNKHTTEGCRTMMDTLMNACFLFWAGKESGIQKYTEAALAQNETVSRCLVRENGSTYHHYKFDPETHKPINGLTWQGYSDESSWARGQAWGVYGMSIAYAYTGAEFLADTHKKVTYYMLNHLPEDLIPYWDLDFTEGDEPRDSSAGAVAVCGLLEMSGLLPDDAPEKQIYESAAAQILESIIDHCTEDEKAETDGLICHVTHALPQGIGIDESAVYGDYFYLEALLRFKKTDWNRYW